MITSTFSRFTSTLHTLLDRLAALLQPLDGLPSLALRLYLAPVFWTAGMNKLAAFSDTVAWFGADGLGLPFPTLMASLATATELSGAVLLTLGLMTRWISTVSYTHLTLPTNREV